MYLSLYLSIYVCMHVCVYACMHVCMHASCIYDDRLFGGAHETAMGGWEMAAGASRAQESQVRRKLPGGLGKGRACGWNCKSVQDVVGPNECLFVCPKPCFLFCGGYPLQLWHSPKKTRFRANKQALIWAHHILNTLTAPPTCSALP